ncbi:alpha/beta hydrolase [Streptomyces sp. 549]|uniref:alpha/beta fold hydrolase n=1 Tax=Streptomyces sp. 549 TaxID=3049076 RepID=UPI0024C23121|nr:alpha/beta hydrolase [Streptomyces sp. 549]MDK1476205.1 alpha/beta hydrolase [Streptomyces sp. 549]
MFEGFTETTVTTGTTGTAESAGEGDTGETVRLHVRHGGSGPPILLLHGHPRTHATWHRVAPRLAAAGYTVVCPDLRGYGRSSKPATDARHLPYSKRAMAGDCTALMRVLGHERFAVVGHDRGAYVAFRLALDHPAAVSALTVLDSVPIGEALNRCDARFAARWWHWFFLGQTAGPAERVINADPDAWYGGDPERMGAEAYEDFRRAVHDPATVHAMCEDYRAGLGVDREHDEADRLAGRQVSCPLQMLWATGDDMVDLYGDVLAVWQPWAGDRLTGGPIESGHHIAEEAPGELAAALRHFWEAGPVTPRHRTAP